MSLLTVIVKTAVHYEASALVPFELLPASLRNEIAYSPKSAWVNAIKSPVILSRALEIAGPFQSVSSTPSSVSFWHALWPWSAPKPLSGLKENSVLDLWGNLSATPAANGIVLTVSDRSPERAAALVNAIAQSLRYDTSQLLQDMADQRLGILERRVAGLARSQSETAQSMPQRIPQPTGARVSGGRLPKIITGSAASINQRGTADNSYLNALAESYSSSYANFQNLERELGPNHPDVVKTRSEIQNIERLIRDEVGVHLGGALGNIDRSLPSAIPPPSAQITGSAYQDILQDTVRELRTLAAGSRGSGAASPVHLPVVAPTVAKLGTTALFALMGVFLASALFLFHIARSGPTRDHALNEARKAQSTPSDRVDDHALEEELPEEDVNQIEPSIEDDPPSKIRTNTDKQDESDPKEQEDELSIIASIPKLAGWDQPNDAGRRFDPMADRLHALFHQHDTVTLCDASEVRYRATVSRLLDLLLRTKDRNDPRTVFLTRAQNAKGQSLLALALAFCASARGQKVLIIDAERKTNAITRYISPPGQFGRHPLNTLFGDDERGVMLLPLARGYGFQDFGCLDPEDRDLFDWIIAQFDFVIVDGPEFEILRKEDPIIEAMDAVLLGMHPNVRPVDLPQAQQDDIHQLFGRCACGLVELPDLAEKRADSRPDWRLAS